MTQLEPSGPEETFVLERTENPHPKMLAAALRARSVARTQDAEGFRSYWFGYLAAMCDATGCVAADIEAWMDRMEANQ